MKIKYVIYAISICLVIGLIGYIIEFILKNIITILIILSCITILGLLIFVISKIRENKIEKSNTISYKEKFYIDRDKKQQNYINSFLTEKEYEIINKTVKSSNQNYEKKLLVTKNEKYFLEIIENYFGINYRIMPQVPLSSIVNKHKEFNKQFQNELYRTIDIGIFDKQTFEPLLMIEINDKSHNQSNRYKRDLKVREILKIANIPLLTFYTNMPNRQEYIINRIKQNLE